MNEKIYNRIEEVEKTGELSSVQSGLEKVVRSERLDYLREEYGEDVSAEELAQTAKNLFNELKENYDIIAPVDFIVDSNQDNETVVGAVVDRIDGSTLEDAKVTDEFISKTEQLYLSVAQYLHDKFKSEDSYLADINSASQYMYGKKGDEVESNIYLVDTDIIFRKGRDGMHMVFYWLTRHMSQMEKRCGRKFVKAHEVIEKYMETSLQEEVAEEQREYLDDLKNFFDNGKFLASPKCAIPPFVKNKYE